MNKKINTIATALKVVGLILLTVTAVQFLFFLFIEPLTKGDMFSVFKAQYNTFFSIFYLVVNILKEFFQGLVLLGIGEIISQIAKINDSNDEYDALLDSLEDDFDDLDEEVVEIIEEVQQTEA